MKEMLAIWENKIGQKQVDGKGISLGDIAIAQVKHYYEAQNFEVDIFTGDTGLRYFAYQPIQKIENQLPMPTLRRKNK